MRNTFIRTLVSLLLVFTMLFAFSACGKTSVDTPDEPQSKTDTPSSSIDSTQPAQSSADSGSTVSGTEGAHDHDDDTEVRLPGEDYSIGENDIVLEHSFEELMTQTDGLFAFPGVSWDSDFSALAEVFGVSAMPYYPELDPELWVHITAGGLEFTAIPYFVDNTSINGTKQCQLIVDDDYYAQANMQGAFDTLLELAQSALGEPAESDLGTPEGYANSFFWTWQTETETGLNRFELYTDVDKNGELTGFGITLINK